MERNADNSRTKLIWLKLVTKAVENIAMWSSSNTEDLHGASFRS